MSKSTSTNTDPSLKPSSTTSTATPPKSNITIRFAKWSELRSIARLLGKAFYDDVLFGRYIHVHRDQYPDDVALFFYYMMMSEFWDWTMRFVVGVGIVAEEGREREVIMGVAQWHRMGEWEGVRRCGWGLAWWDLRRLLEPLFHTLSTIQSHIHPNRAIVPSKIDILHRSDAFTSHLWSGPRQNRWYLHFLAVHPDHQGHGLGRRLVAWGIEQARMEGVGASVVAAFGKDRFYQNCGFAEVIGTAGMGEGNPLADVPGGNIWWIGFGSGSVGSERGREEGEGKGHGEVVEVREMLSKETT